MLIVNRSTIRLAVRPDNQTLTYAHSHAPLPSLVVSVDPSAAVINISMAVRCGTTTDTSNASPALVLASTQNTVLASFLGGSSLSSLATPGVTTVRKQHTDTDRMAVGVPAFQLQNNIVR